MILILIIRLICQLLNPVNVSECNFINFLQIKTRLLSKKHRVKGRYRTPLTWSCSLGRLPSTSLSTIYIRILSLIILQLATFVFSSLIFWDTKLSTPYLISSKPSRILIWCTFSSWPSLILVKRMEWRKVHGLQRKIRNSSITFRNMGMGNGEPFPRMQV